MIKHEELIISTKKYPKASDVPVAASYQKPFFFDVEEYLGLENYIVCTVPATGKRYRLQGVSIGYCGPSVVNQEGLFFITHALSEAHNAVRNELLSRGAVIDTPTEIVVPEEHRNHSIDIGNVHINRFSTVVHMPRVKLRDCLKYMDRILNSQSFASMGSQKKLRSMKAFLRAFVSEAYSPNDDPKIFPLGKRGRGMRTSEHLLTF